MSNQVALEIAQLLLDIQAVSLRPDEPYVWTSGLKTPIYCDNRLIMSYPEVRTTVETALAKLIQSEFEQVDIIAGVATAGIPHASIVAHLLNKPMVYIRSDAKKHGKKNAIEGNVSKGSRVVVIEDLISTGKSVLHAAQCIEEAGGNVIGCAAIFNYLLPVGKEAFAKVNYPLVTLTNYEWLVQQALKVDQLKLYQDELESWYKDPQAWSQKHA